MAQSDVIQENFFQAIDTIVQNRIANLPYDKTIECEVIDTSQSTQNIYTVKYQEVTFKVVSNINKIKVGDIVFVTIPEGDFRKEKFIAAVRSKENVKEVKVLPFLNFVKGNNLFSKTINKTEFKLQLNSNLNTEREFTFLTFHGEEIAYGYTKLGIKATFSSNINTPLISGDYGLKITIQGYDQTYQTKSSAELLSNVRIYPDIYKNELYLSHKDMVGTNLYNTHGFQNQEKVFDITGWVIDSIVVSLWQDNNFKDEHGNLITDKYITITGLEMYLGYDIKEVNEYPKPTFILKSKDGLLYTTPIGNELITKDVEFDVIYKQENENTYLEDTSLFVLPQNVTTISDIEFECYDPISEISHEKSNKNFFITYNNATYVITSNNDIQKIIQANLTLNPNARFYDEQKVGFCYTFNIFDKVQSKNIIYTSNELWFVHTKSQSLLKDLLSYGLSIQEKTEDLILEGSLIFSSPELLFKSKDGNVILRLNNNSSQFMGNANTASSYDMDGKIYQNFKKIEEVLQRLAPNQYKMI